ncbi:MAG: aminomethyl-transferring glycine dehydrogenase subunit GcvPA [Planctomycetaceae bacterium]|nr:aminomethyl-transferring glycine dehydrogenase subunit GcvPA [Planctomycetaceae bacterium]
MSYLFNTSEDQKAMLEAIGVGSLDELFSQLVPDDSRLHRPLDIPPAMSEIELTSHMQALAAKNTACSSRPTFLGAGSYDHFIPAAVDAIAGRGEFFTSYTPYQPEVSQGNLTVTFEYQSFITRLTGMDVANASLYDGGTAVAEAAMMSLEATGRRGRVVVAGTMHPEYRQTLATYLACLGVELVTVGYGDASGTVSPADVAAACNDQTACVLVQHPNFFGSLEDVEAIGQAAHAAGAMFCVSVDPISLGMLKRPGDYGADVVTAEGQSLGNPLHYGGPYLGIIACKNEFVRRMPGRIAGQTVDREGRRCWVLTLQTREQHIRREKATSNICTNQGLFALRATIYLSLMGPQGMLEVAELCARKSHYARQLLNSSSRFSAAFTSPTFKEFVVRDASGHVEQLLADAEREGVFAGVALGRWYPELADCFLVCVTEKRTKDEIDRLAFVLNSASTLQSPATAAELAPTHA